MNARNRRPCGFTLLEVLVSLVVLGLILTGLEQGLHFGMVVSKKTDLDLQRTTELEATDRALRNLLGHIALSDDGSGKASAFRGVGDSFSFSGILPDGVASERHAEMTLLVDDRHHLVLRWRPAPHIDALDLPAPVTTEILDHVDNLEISYGPYGAQGDLKSSWSANEPPKLVRIQIISAEAAARHWPSIIVRLPGE